MKYKFRFLMLLSFFATTMFSGAAKERFTAAGNPHDSLSIVVPNIFTPNSDGINDTWSMIVHDYGITIFELQTTVYDRWGTEVFQTTNIREVWAGHGQNGKPCNAGSYFYIISYTNGSTGKSETLKGFVELLR